VQEHDTALDRLRHRRVTLPERADLTQLEEGDEPVAPPRQRQRAVAGGARQPHDLGRLGQPGLAVVGGRDGVAVPGQRVPEHRLVPELARHRHRFLAEGEAPGLALHERQRHGQPGQHPGAKAGRTGVEGAQRLLEQLDLHRVEQLHLESAEAGAQAQRGPGQLVGVAPVPGDDGGLLVGLPGGGGVAAARYASPRRMSSSAS
jgi:hypothetical protein